MMTLIMIPMLTAITSNNDDEKHNRDHNHANIGDANDDKKQANNNHKNQSINLVNGCLLSSLRSLKVFRPLITI